MKRIFTLLIAFSVAAISVAQDIHYSQFYNAPLLLNPALTGMTTGSGRVSITYRNQWFGATGSGFFKSPYMTTALSGDLPIKIKNDALGVGLFIANDQAGANTFSTFITQASVSYMKTLGKKSNHRLSAGFQIGYTFQSIKVETFQWASQFSHEDNQFSPGTTSYNPENIGTNKIGYLNMNFGLFWYSKLTDKVAMYTGGSFYNVTTPNHTILPNQKRDLYWRWNVHAALDITVGSKYHILPSGQFMRQGVNDQLNTGIGFGIDFKERGSRTDDPMSLTLGVYNRIHNIPTGVTSDAIIPYIGFDIKRFRLGITYDATISSLKTTGPGIGAFEISVAYTIKKKGYSRRDDFIAPRF
jgi:type IX secretion system PorP/SprF family membrane protein